ncbi:hypothetical protein [Actinomadura verrucosospora]|uniref:Uncharacterized protein n=1 Tax=Actinomadura verrucosospora TaxID=46165 RepID=A0A7D3VTE8_ACTVE|nr:hypothetical protein [Actinomadura verrucosospora]QKG22359.1 hypothetical protein ACTIVE_3999 [Actinomadura verrucosospora]
MPADGAPGEPAGMLQVARAHREHERFHSLAKLEEAAALRRDSNVLKMLADHWSDAGAMRAGPADPRHGAVGCPDLNGPAVVTATGVLFMEGESEPAELTAMKARLGEAGTRYRRLSRWLAQEMEAEWPRLAVLTTPRHIAAARARFMALTRTTAAGDAYGLAAHLLTTAAAALRDQDLTPAGVRAGPATAAAMLRNASWLVDTAAGVIAEAAARLGASDPDWTAFITAMAPETA